MKQPKTYALLSSAGLLTGYETATRKPRRPHVEVPKDCDLVPGRYRYVNDTFVPLADDEAALASDPTALHCIAPGFASLHNQGVELHPETVAWLGRYEDSFDNKGVDGPRRVKRTR